jgi:Flp pilus assembly protein TadD
VKPDTQDIVARNTQDAADTAQMLAHFANRQPAQAGAIAGELVARHPDYGLGWKVLGMARHSMGHNEEALAAMQRAVRCLPDDIDAHGTLIQILLQTGRLPAALAQCHAAQAVMPDHARTLALLGVTLTTQGKQDEAIQIYRRALELDADEITAHASLAQLLMFKGVLPTAVEHFRHALRCRLERDTVLTAAPPTAPFNHPDNEKLLWQILAQLAQAGVHAFAFAGTLLGLVREGGLLPFDKDLDIALPFAEMASACACLQAHGWTELPRKMPLVNPRAFRHDQSEMVVDLCALMPETAGGKHIGGFWCRDLPWAWQRVTEYPSNMGLHQVQRPEGMVWVLDEPEILLEILYGHWRTPDHDFDTVIAAHNLRGFALLTQCYAFDRINDRWRDGRLRKALSLTRHSLRHLPQDVLLQQVALHLEAALATQEVSVGPESRRD